MKIDAIAKGLDAGHHTRKKLCVGRCLEVFEESLDGCLAKISQKQLFPQPFAPLLKPLGEAGRTKSSGVTGQHQEAFLPTVGTADAGKSATGVTAVEIALDHLLDDGPEETILLLKAVLIFSQELVKVMEEDAVKDGALRISRPVYFSFPLNSLNTLNFTLRYTTANIRRLIAVL